VQDLLHSRGVLEVVVVQKHKWLLVVLVKFGKIILFEAGAQPIETKGCLAVLQVLLAK